MFLNQIKQKTNNVERVGFFVVQKLIMGEFIVMCILEKAILERLIMATKYKMRMQL